MECPLKSSACVFASIALAAARGDRFAAGDAYACDCDTSTGERICDIFDFVCFQDAFVLGCAANR